MRACALFLGLCACGARTSLDVTLPNKAGTPVSACAHTASHPFVVVGSPPLRLASDNLFLYFTDGQRLQRIAKTGGAVETLSTVQTPGLALDDAFVYFSGPGGTTKLPKSGGPEQVITKEVGIDFAVDETNVYLTVDNLETPTAIFGVAKTSAYQAYVYQSKSLVGGVAASAGWVYFTTWLPGRLSRAPAGGGPDEILSEHQADFAQDLVVDKQHAFWTTQLEHAGIWSVPIDGGATSRIATPKSDVHGIAMDDGFVYWAEWNPNGSVWKTPKDGGPSVELARAQAFPRAVVVDEACVYWSVNGPPGITAAPKTL